MFVKGKSGNPGGRPKESLTFSKKAQAYGVQALQVLVDALSSVEEKYRIAAAEILLNRAYGRPSQEITTPDGTLGTSVINIIRAETNGTQRNTDTVSRSLPLQQ